MNTVSIILDAMDEVLSLDKEEMSQMLDVNLLEEGLIDSLSILTLLEAIEERVGYPVDIKKMKPVDFSTVNMLSKAIENQAK